jgi:DnaJ-class molecular chaperone
MVELTIKYKDLVAAKKLLKLPDRASMGEIKSCYRKLIKRWHPDRCQEDDEKCNEMTRKITAAYNIVVAYCRQYRYSFAEEEVKKYLSPEEWWFERFGDDPLMGKINKH